MVEAAKQFLEEVKVEEKEGGPVADDETEKSGEPHTAMPAVVENIKDELTEHTVADIKIAEQLDPNKDSVTCNEIVEHKQNDPNEGSVTCNEDKQNDPNEGSVTCNEIAEGKQNDPNESSVTCNEIAQNDPSEGLVTCNEVSEDKQNDPNEGSVTYNEANTDGATADEELTKEQVRSENGRGHEKSELLPADFLSGTV